MCTINTPVTQVGWRRAAVRGISVVLRAVQSRLPPPAEAQLDQRAQDAQDSVHCQPERRRLARRPDHGIVHMHSNTRATGMVSIQLPDGSKNYHGLMVYMLWD